MSKKDIELKLERNERMAEMIGIILGDGHLHKRNEHNYNYSALIISLNQTDDPEYVTYVKVLMQQLFGQEPKLHKRKGTKGIDLRLYGDNLVEELIALGLETGDKVKNQVKVPNWIKREKTWISEHSNQWFRTYRSLVICCIKGLLDKDGSIYLARRDKTIGIIFKNASYPLVLDFKEMCESLGIRIGKIITTWNKAPSTGKRYKAYHAQIQAKEQVNNFLEIINPMKWKYKKEGLLNELKEL